MKVLQLRRTFAGLELKEVDAITIATPDHWHTPMAIAGLRAGKHVYLEKPCSHNPAEGEMLIRAQQKYQTLVQVGTQQRSSPHTIEIVERIHGGIIGRPYFAKAWYSNVRTRQSVQAKRRGCHPSLTGTSDKARHDGGPIGTMCSHTTGTGCMAAANPLNNGTHEIDICRWALGVDYPKRVSSSGGRYPFRDDWECYDSLVTCFEYEDRMISWEGKSCQGMKYYGRDRGSAIMGTTGTVVVDRDGYEICDHVG
jgi:predicted dehydrogenase